MMNIQNRPVVLTDLAPLNYDIEIESRRLSRSMHLELVSAILNGEPIFLLFDKDGLLVNSEFVRKVAWINAFEQFGIDTGLGSSEEKMIEFADAILEVGWDAAVDEKLKIPALEHLARMGGLTEEKANAFLLHHYGDAIRSAQGYEDDDQVIKVLRQFRQVALDSDTLQRHFTLRPGVENLLQTVEQCRPILQSEFNCQIGSAVVTSDNPVDTKEGLANFGIIDHFQAFVCAGDAKRSKPHGDPYKEGLLRLENYFQHSGPSFQLGFEDASLGVDSFVDAGMKGYFVKDLIDEDIDRTKAIKSNSLSAFAESLKEAIRVASEIKQVTQTWELRKRVADQLVIADEHRIKSEYDVRDSIYRALLQEEEQTPGILTSVQLADIKFTFADTNRRKGNISEALIELQNLSRMELPPTSVLKIQVATAWCYYRDWNDKGRTDETIYQRIIKEFKKAVTFVNENEAVLDVERAAQAIEGYIGVLVEGEHHEQALGLCPELMRLNSKLTDPSLVRRATEQVMTIETACLMHMQRYTEAMELSKQGADLSVPGRHRIAHHFAYLEARALSRQRATQADSHYVGSIANEMKEFFLGDNPTEARIAERIEVLKESQSKRELLKKWYPFLEQFGAD